MQLSEKEVEDFMFEDLTKNKGGRLNERGFTIPSMYHDGKVVWKRQLNIEPYGILDLAGFYRSEGAINIDLIELKAVDLHPDHFEQTFRYRKGLEIYTRNTFPKTKFRLNINAHLVGAYYDGFYTQNYAPITIASYKYDLTGLAFKQHEAYCGWMIDTVKSFRK